MFDESLMIKMMLSEANNEMISKVKKGELTLEDSESEELLLAWLRANLNESGQILSILECWANLLYQDNMEREYIIQFINRIREKANTQQW